MRAGRLPRVAREIGSWPPPASRAQGRAGFRSLGVRPGRRGAGQGGGGAGRRPQRDPTKGMESTRQTQAGYRRCAFGSQSAGKSSPSNIQGRGDVFGVLQFVSVAFRTTMFPHDFQTKPEISCQELDNFVLSCRKTKSPAHCVGLKSETAGGKPPANRSFCDVKKSRPRG